MFYDILLLLLFEIFYVFNNVSQPVNMKREHDNGILMMFNNVHSI